MKHSLKKSLGTWGTIVIYVISAYGAYKVPTLIPQILGVLSVLVAGLFSIKKYGTKLPGPEEK